MGCAGSTQSQGDGEIESYLVLFTTCIILLDKAKKEIYFFFLKSMRQTLDV